MRTLGSTSRAFGILVVTPSTARIPSRSPAAGQFHTATARRDIMTRDPDYSSWSNADLIRRVTDLETQLRDQNTRYATGVSPASSSPGEKKETKKKWKAGRAAKVFDPSKYSTRLIALKFAYLGSNYNGFEHHSNNTTPLPTIEEELWKALKKTRLLCQTHEPGKKEDEVSWDDCEYSKCGRTDRGVSAFGQVIGIRVRSNRPKVIHENIAMESTEEGTSSDVKSASTESIAPEFDPIQDELPYVQLINRCLPPDIRAYAWCPNPPTGFSARFNCKERRYRYFFTNPAYAPLPSSQPPLSGRSSKQRPEEGWLDLEAMQEAAKKYEGLHDFRNFCKVDPSKQITNFERRIFHAGIHEVRDGVSNSSQDSTQGTVARPRLFYFEVRGSAFLWHQVRHLVAMLFLIGQGYEEPHVIDDLLDIEKTPAKPVYEMASDVPLVLWDCIFPEAKTLTSADHANGGATSAGGYEDALEWIHVGDEAFGRVRAVQQSGIEYGKYGRNGIMEELWALWRKRKIEEVLTWSLMDAVATQGTSHNSLHSRSNGEDKGNRVFDGSETPRSVGKYLPVMQRERMDEPEVVNARYAARKGLNISPRAVVENQNSI